MRYPHSVFEKKLREVLQEEINRVSSVLVSGAAVNDYAEYRQLVGRVAALEAVIGYCDDINGDLNKVL